MIEIIIWLIFFPLATTLNRYLIDKSKLLRGEDVTEKDVRYIAVFIELIIWIAVLVFLIRRFY